MNRLPMTMLSAVVALTAAGLSGCDSDGGSEEFCTAEAYASVVLRVVDEKDQGILLPPGSVTYTLDGGETRVVEAEFETLDNPVAIYSWAGRHVIAVAPSGYEPGEIMVDVEETDDGCHVVTEERELVLETAAD